METNDHLTEADTCRLSVAELGTKRIFHIEPGDLVFNIVFAWEGAVAVARDEDRGRVGSHRFLTCVPKPELATAGFLLFHFQTQDGLAQLGSASPGGAGRNRTLGMQALAEILVPVPSIEQQHHFESLRIRSNAIHEQKEQNLQKMTALVPAILDRAFRGEL